MTDEQDIYDLTAQINDMPHGLEHKVMSPKVWETLSHQAALYRREIDAVPEMGPQPQLKPEVEHALDAAQVFEEMKAEGLTEPTPEDMAQRLGVDVEQLAAVFLQGIAVFKQAADIVASFDAQPTGNIVPNRKDRRAANRKKAQDMKRYPR